MPAWQQNIKQLIDITGSMLALIITLPLSIFLAIAIRIESRGPVIFSQRESAKEGSRSGF
ncbi:MAG: sugar transferase [Bacteroidales bacterium]